MGCATSKEVATTSNTTVTPTNTTTDGTVAKAPIGHSHKQGRPRLQAKASPGIEAPEVPTRTSFNCQTPPEQRAPTEVFQDLYLPGGELGFGAFSKVLVATEKATKRKYAVKHIYDRSKMEWNGRDTLQDEIHNLKQLRKAPGVLQLHDVFVHSQDCYLVAELLPGGELFARIIQKGSFTENEARDSCRSILQALSYMHERRIVHRDLKPENLLLADALDFRTVKLCDFGFSKTIETRNGCRTLAGTLGYAAPEVLEHWPAYDVPCDVWSFGVVLFFLLGGYPPFLDSHGSINVTQVIERTRTGQYFFYPEHWKNISHLAKDLVAKCLTVNPNKRISAEEALDHEWMADPKKAPTTQISARSLANSVLAAQHANALRRRQRQTGGVDRRNELKEDSSSSIQQEKSEEAVVAHTDCLEKIGAADAVAALKDDSSNGHPFARFYSKGESLGEGGFATVHRCTHKHTGRRYAVKEVDTSQMSEAVKCYIEHEIVTMQYLRGFPHVIRLCDVFREPNKTYMVLEEMVGGNLLDRVSDKDVYTEREARELCKTLFRAVNYCHKKRIAHRDIKLENLLLLEKGCDASIKLADFGFAKKVAYGNCLYTICGTPGYMAPEIFCRKTNGYDYRCDMWSVGVVVYHLLGGYLPFEGTRKELEAMSIRGEYHFHEESWKKITPAAKHMISCLMDRNTDTRKSAEQVLSCSWMGLRDEELSVIDLSVTQSKIRDLRTSKEKFKNVANAIMGANKWTQIVDRAKDEHNFNACFRPVREEAKFEDVYSIGKKVGDGIFGDIHLATHKRTNRELTVKQIVRRALRPRDVAALQDEISVLQLLKDCEQVVRLEEVFEDPDNTFLVTESVKGHSLFDRLIQNKTYTEFDGKELARNLLLGVAHCHEKRIAIRNLRLENLRLPHGTETSIKIIDFEFAKKAVFPNSLHTKCGTQEYVAPEVLENRPAYDVSCDMWAVGVIVFLTMGGYYPFRGEDDEQILKNVRYGVFKFHHQYWKGASKDAKSLIQKMLSIEPQRISAKDALTSVWINADYATLSADLKDGMQTKLRDEQEIKFRGAVRVVVATKKLQSFGHR